jgi:hypothetical protein
MEEEDQVHKCARIMAAAKKIGVVMRKHGNANGLSYSFCDPVGGLETFGQWLPDRLAALESACESWQKVIQVIQ